MLSSVRAWNLLAQGGLSDAVLLTAKPRWSREKMVQPGRTDSLKQWQGDMQVPQPLLWVGWGEGAAIFPADTWSWSQGQHLCERGSFYLSLRLRWNSNPQPASACLAEQVREHGLEHPPPPLLQPEVSPHPLPSLASRQHPAQHPGKQAEATVNNLLLSI